jgi:hypothetical protein
LEKFAVSFPPDQVVGAEREPYVQALSAWTSSAASFASLAGSSFGSGIYRLYSVLDVAKWTRNVEATFPNYRNRICCFGRDWLCNQFCLDKNRVVDGEAQILLFEIATGKVLEIPETLESFHSNLLLSDPNAALMQDVFQVWRLQDQASLAANDCVGYDVPLFLGGKDDVSNLERTDAGVYWELTSQILLQTQKLPTGTPISSFDVVTKN